MKKAVPVIIVAAIAAAAAAIIFAMQIPQKIAFSARCRSGSTTSNNMQIPQKIAFSAEAAAYLSEKYGVNGDCVYSRMGYTDSHRDILGNGYTTEYPDFAVFESGENSIAVQRKDGRFCDDGQNADFGYILAEHFAEKCGVDITFAELRSCSNGSIPDSTITNVLRSDNSLLNKDNIEDILLTFADSQPLLELALYIPDKYPDRRELTDKLSAGLSEVTENEGFSLVRYFLYSADEELIVNSTLGASKDKKIDSPEYRALNFPYYYAANPYLHSVLRIEGTVYCDKPVNTFTAAGWCVMDRGYSAGLGSNPYEEWNGWNIYSLMAG